MTRGNGSAERLKRTWEKATVAQGDPSRLLVVDDTESVHTVFQRIFPAEASSADALERLSTNLFGGSPASPRSREQPTYVVDFATQGMEAVECVRKRTAEGMPYCVAFVDIVMPPGINGIETTKLLWAIDPCLQVVLCTAYSEFRWDEVTGYLGNTASLHLLRKPFSPSEVRRMADVLATKALRLRRS